MTVFCDRESGPLHQAHPSTKRDSQVHTAGSASGSGLGLGLGLGLGVVESATVVEDVSGSKRSASWEHKDALWKGARGCLDIMSMHHPHSSSASFKLEIVAMPCRDVPWCAMMACHDMGRIYP